MIIEIKTIFINNAKKPFGQKQRKILLNLIKIIIEIYKTY